MPATIDIRKGSPADEQTLLRLFDEAVAWMVARGQSAQWGDRPFSERPETRRRVHEMAQHEGLWIAERDGASVGALIVGARPAHVHPIGARELYIELLISSRAHARNDIGGHLVRRADALAEEARRPGPARRLLGGGADARRLVRAAGVRPRRHVRLPRLDGPGLREGDPGEPRAGGS